MDKRQFCWKMFRQYKLERFHNENEEMKAINMLRNFCFSIVFDFLKVHSNIVTIAHLCLLTNSSHVVARWLPNAYNSTKTLKEATLIAYRS